MYVASTTVCDDELETKETLKQDSSNPEGRQRKLKETTIQVYTAQIHGFPPKFTISSPPFPIDAFGDRTRAAP